MLAIVGDRGSRRFGAACAPGTAESVECFDTTGSGTVRGLGRVSLTTLLVIDTAPEGCPPESFRVLGSPVRLSVAAKGTIEITVGGVTDCKTLASVLRHTRSFTVVAGTGATPVRRAPEVSGSRLCSRTTERLEQSPGKGTFSVPGLDFDLVPPSISGVTAKTVRMPRGAAAARVRYSVTALDDRDGAVPVTCKPKPGTRFRAGRTHVTCTATDTSGNSQVARFWVTVRRAR